MRKSFEGLSAVIEELFPGELLSGAFFIFLNRRKDHIKVLGAEAGAILLSLVQTCRGLKINPSEYLEDIMRRKNID